MLMASWVNGIQSNTVSIQDRGFSFGDGLFETMRIYKQHIPLIDRHFKRLNSSLQKLDIFFNTNEVKRKCQKIANEHNDATLKVIITRGQTERGYGTPHNTRPNIAISLFDRSKELSASTQDGIKIYVCQTQLARQPLLAGLKHLNRLEQVLAKQEVDKKGCIEGVILDTNSNVVEGVMSNLFMVVDSKLITPSLLESGVKGVQRDFILDQAGTIGVESTEKLFPINALKNADEIFLCNSNYGIWPVVEFNDKGYQIGQITRKLQKIISKELFPQ